MTYTISIKGQTRSFESSLSDSEALEAIKEAPSNFARDLYAKRARLSPAQMAWVHKLATERVNPPAIKATVASGSIDMSAVETLFANAEGSRLKRPAITIDLGGSKIKLKKAGSKSRYTGQIQITDGGEYGSSKYYGRVDNGNFIPGRDLDENIRTTLVEIAKDPIGYAKTNGLKTGNCCFCSIPLSDERSTKEGYGPVCAKKWGLPWGGPVKARKIERSKPTPEPLFVCPLPENPVPKATAVGSGLLSYAPWTTDDGVNFVAEMSDLQAPGCWRFPGGGELPMLRQFQPSYLDDELVGWTFERDGKTFSIFND